MTKRVFLLVISMPTAVLTASVNAQAQARWKPIYSSANLTNHSLSFEPNPGMTSGPTCYIEDVGLQAYADHGGVAANTRLSNIFVNAIGYKKFYDNLPSGDPISLGIYKYSSMVRLPAVPFAGVSQTQNPQCVQMMIQLYDGTNALWENNKTSLEATVYWDLNPWTADCGKVKVYTMEGGSLKLLDTGLSVITNTDWHSFEIVADLAHRQWISACCDGYSVDLSNASLAYVAHPEWDNSLGLSLSTESMNCFPGTSFVYVFSWTTEFKNVQFNRLEFDAGFASPPLTGGCVNIEWESEPFAKYRIRTSEDLFNWTQQTNLWTGTGTNLLFSEPIAGRTNRFYRVYVEP